LLKRVQKDSCGQIIHVSEILETVDNRGFPGGDMVPKELLFRKIYFSVDFLAFLYYIRILNGSGKFIFREKSEFPDRPPGQ